MTATGRHLTIEGKGHPPVSGIVVEAADAVALLVLGHGAGAPMTHPFMELLAGALAGEGISTLRYNFAYMEAGRKRPDYIRRLLAVVRSALLAGKECADGLPLLAGGKSMGGRMTSTLVAERAQAVGTGTGNPANRPGENDAAYAPGKQARAQGASVALAEPATQDLRGLVFFGFPLHAPGRHESVRGDHLAHVPCPMLFHQGTRDRLADLGLLRPLLERIGMRATLHVVEGGDHSLGMLKRSGRTQDDVLAEVAAVTRRWTEGVLAGTGRAT
ncbi:MAG: alpha/beta hydrolase [Gemmatimonadota bacterium]|nr:alpha/beta hydrolase [Gemmatimonadota bacterium]MDE2677879.1 alpha/beta hydrolase [Gemmatimonadota bacterium]